MQYHKEKAVIELVVKIKSRKQLFKQKNSLVPTILTVLTFIIIILAFNSTSSRSQKTSGFVSSEETFEKPICNTPQICSINNYPGDQLDILMRNPIDIDKDQDGLTDEEEAIYKTNPELNDTDYDGLLDGYEVFKSNTYPVNSDSDGDGLDDYEEIFQFRTDPCCGDTDGDGLRDGREVVVYRSNPRSSDTDHDQLGDYEEVFVYNTNLLSVDTDMDGLVDSHELFTLLTDPLLNDTDGDSLSDCDEVYEYLTDPLSPDSDGDGQPDGWEIEHNRNPLQRDNWERVFGLYVAPIIAGCIALFATVLSAMPKNASGPRHFVGNNFGIHPLKPTEILQEELFELLCSLPESEQFTITELEERTGCSRNEIAVLLESIFSKEEVTEMLEAYSNELTFAPSVLGASFEYTCFYCGEVILYRNTHCDFCGEEIVRCYKCNKPIANQEKFAICTECGVIGDMNQASGFVTVKHLCNSCLSQRWSHYV